MLSNLAESIQVSNPAILDAFNFVTSLQDKYETQILQGVEGFMTQVAAKEAEVLLDAVHVDHSVPE